jgi:hypothetical protein
VVNGTPAAGFVFQMTFKSAVFAMGIAPRQEKKLYR